MVNLEIDENGSQDHRDEIAITFGNSDGPCCLEFTGTLDHRSGRTKPKDYLKSYFCIVTWAETEGFITDTEAQALSKRAEEYPLHAKAVLNRAVLLREAIYRIFSSIAENQEPDESALDMFNDELVFLMGKTGIVFTGAGFEWDWTNDDETLDRVLWPMIESASYLLISERLERVRKCAAEDCNSLFMDLTKNRSRRWCDMKGCGNRAKARKHYRKAKQSS